MPVDLIVAFGAIALLSVFVGIAVKGLLAASSQGSAIDDDVMARAAHVGDTHLPEFIARHMRERRAAKVRAELPDALYVISILILYHSPSERVGLEPTLNPLGHSTIEIAPRYELPELTLIYEYVLLEVTLVDSTI